MRTATPLRWDRHRGTRCDRVGATSVAAAIVISPTGLHSAPRGIRWGAHRVVRRGLDTRLGNEYGLGPLVAVQVMMRDDGMPERPALDYGEQRVEGLGKVRHGRSPFGLVAGE